MCTDNPDMPKEANKAKCFVIACFVFSIFSMIGFGVGVTGAIGAVGGILACVASSILICCSPKSTAEGNGKYTAACVMLFIAGIVQVVCGIVVVVWMVAALNETNKNSYCDDRWVDCTTDSDGDTCRNNGFYGWGDNDNVKCSKDCMDGSYCGTGESTKTYSCDFKSSYEFCQSIHGDVKDAVSGIIIIIGGIAATFLFIAGILNNIGGYYCFKARAAIGAKAIAPSS